MRVWKMSSVENEECGNAECAKLGVWKIRSVANEEWKFFSFIFSLKAI